MGALVVHGAYVLRIIIATFCGFVIGYERKNRSKEAGVRTHCVVACGAALMMIVSKYAFSDMQGMGDFYRLDVSRVAAGIVSGIGFLGAGMIFVHNQSVSGLTTAAGVWTTAGIGMTIGAGMYIEGVIATAILLMIQILMHASSRFVRSTVYKRLIVYGVTEDDFVKKAESKLKTHDTAIVEVNVSSKHRTGEMNYEFLLDMPSAMKAEDIVKMFEYDCELTAKR